MNGRRVAGLGMELVVLGCNRLYVLVYLPRVACLFRTRGNPSRNGCFFRQLAASGETKCLRYQHPGSNQPPRKRNHSRVFSSSPLETRQVAVSSVKDHKMRHSCQEQKQSSGKREISNFKWYMPLLHLTRCYSSYNKLLRVFLVSNNNRVFFIFKVFVKTAKIRVIEVLSVQMRLMIYRPIFTKISNDIVQLVRTKTSQQRQRTS